MFHGKTSKHNATSWPHRSTLTNSFNMFWSHSCLDGTHQFWSQLDHFWKRSSSKYDTWKTAKFKMVDFLLGLAYVCKRLFCASGCNTCIRTDFHVCRRNLLSGVLHFKGSVWPHSFAKFIPYVEAWTVNKHMKFQSDWTKYNKVKATFCETSTFDVPSGWHCLMKHHGFHNIALPIS